MIQCPGCGEDNPPRFRLCGYCGATLLAAAPALAPRELRKTVTLIFSDLKDSTALGDRLDPELLHEVKERYFSAMAAEITRHGGKIEKYIGDAIMAVFGLPRAHEDDALRAVRAAIGMRSELARVNADLRARYGVTLAHRTGVNTGEVVTNADPGTDQKLATGDAVNVAARLEQAAPAGEIYLGELSYQLVRDAVEVEAVEPLELKGKPQRVPAYRLVDAPGLDGNVRRVDTPIVGRDAELATLAEVYREVATRRCVRLVTVVGDAGVGKSRLMHETLEHIAAGALTLRGRCLPYGDGITYWPLRGMLFGAAGILADDSPQAARARLLARLADADVCDRLAAACGLSSAPFPLHEMNWAARRFLEILAADGPVVALVDDIHWAEPAFLDLLDHVLATADAHPILLLATTRHDLLEERPQWGEQAGATRLLLSPLSEAASAEVVGNLLGDTGLPADLVRRIVCAAEGNPLYVEQMLSMLIDNGTLVRQGGTWVRTAAVEDIAVPPTIHALLEARLDQLSAAERATVEPAAVIGLEFVLSAVRSLAPVPIQPTIEQPLGLLERHQFIRNFAAAQNEPTFRFLHHLVRDTVYSGLLKRARATLHLEFVRWADRINADRDRALEFEELLGYHLEQAHRYLRELGALDAQGQATGRDAAGRLASAARRVYARGDLHAANNLFQRAVAVLEADDPQRCALLPEWAETLTGLGNFDAARERLAEAMATSAASPSRARVQASCRLMGLIIDFYSGEHGADWGRDALATIDGLSATLEREGARNELATAWRLVMGVHSLAGHYQLAGEAAERSTAQARAAGNHRLVAKVGSVQASNAVLAPIPVPQAIAQCEALIASGLGDRMAESAILCSLAQLRAMNGELDEARRLYRRGRALLQELGKGVIAASTGMDVALVEWHGGDLAMAEREVRADYEFLERKGAKYFLSTMAALLALLVRDQGRDAEALDWSLKAEAATADDDVLIQAIWRAARAPILARAGQCDEALVMARQAVELMRQTETPSLQADALGELASVLLQCGQPAPARAALEEALALYTLKGNRPHAARTATRLAALSAG